MLTIYQGRENIDKERFIYEHAEGEPLVIVPNQYTHIAEEQALHYLNTPCLLNVEVLSMSRLGLRMLQEQGKENIRTLDSYERFMLLSRIIRNRESQLEVFRTAANKQNFVDMVNDFISSFKQQECSAEELNAILEDPETDELLRKKIRELYGIMEEYEAMIQGKYRDVEDYIDLYTEAIGKSQSLRTKDVWVYGFDSMTAKFRSALVEIAQVAKSVNVMVNQSDFHLETYLIEAIRRSASDKNISVEVLDLPVDPREQSETIRRIEADLFTEKDKRSYDSQEFQPKDLQVVECANLYNQAENAAVYIYKLLRKGYRMKDIVIICNDSQEMQPIIGRVFREYGLPIFLDKRRGVRDSQVVGFVVSLLDIGGNGYRTPSVLSLLKSGLTGLSEKRIWNLENYVKSYGIKGSMWTKPFRFGSFDYTEEEFAELEESRAYIAQRIQQLAEIGEKEQTVAEFIESLYGYLQEVWNLRGVMQEIEDDQYERKMFEEAQWTAQSYNEVLRILGCVRNIMGNETLDMKEFSEMYSIGIMNAEVGLIPPTKDGLTMGSMIRTRVAPPKVVMVLSANDGVLPQLPPTEGLFSLDEKSQFARHDFALGNLDDLRMLEENVAMYRTVSQASEKLYISYSLADGDGSDMKPSILVESLHEIFPKLHERKDAVSRGFNSDLVQNGPEALRHMMTNFKEKPVDQMMKLIEENREEAEAEGNLEADADAQGDGIDMPADSQADLLPPSDSDTMDTPTDSETRNGEKAEKQEKNEKKEKKVRLEEAEEVVVPKDEKNYLAEGIIRWYEKNNPEMLRELSLAGLDENEALPLLEGTAGRLYKRGDAFVMSASKLESYQHCPFSYFLRYGIRAEELREYESGGREIGDVYHECLKGVSQRLIQEGILEKKTKSRTESEATNETEVNAESNQDLQKVTDEKLAKMVDEELERISRNYRGGLFVSNQRESYRMERIRRICLEAARAVDRQFKEERLTGASFEEKYGRGCEIEPIEYTLHGEKVYIEGTIDRIDRLQGGGVSIVDYKTGTDKVNIERMRVGYKMQLMVYLDAASGKTHEPIGMFYFNISDGQQNATTQSKSNEQLREAAENRFVLNGIMVDTDQARLGIPPELRGVSKNARKKKELPPEVFQQLRQDVHKTIEQLSDDMIQGKVDISPAREDKSKSACTYCDYRAVCKFDLSYRKNSYRVMPK